MKSLIEVTLNRCESIKDTADTEMFFKHSKFLYFREKVHASNRSLSLHHIRTDPFLIQ